MKNILIIIGAAFLMFEGFVLAATNQPRALGSVSLQSATAAQIAALSGNTTGQLLYCSDCAANGGRGTVCISTGVLVNSFVLSTGTVCK